MPAGTARRSRPAGSPVGCEGWPTVWAALDGSIAVESPAGIGTVLRAVMPIRAEASIRATGE
jgi:hypothetical protein